MVQREPDHQRNRQTRGTPEPCRYSPTLSEARVVNHYSHCSFTLLQTLIETYTFNRWVILDNMMYQRISALKHGLDRARHMLSDRLRTTGLTWLRHTAAIALTRSTNKYLGATPLIVIAAAALLVGMLAESASSRTAAIFRKTPRRRSDNHRRSYDMSRRRSHGRCLWKSNHLNGFPLRVFCMFAACRAPQLFQRGTVCRLTYGPFPLLH